MTLFFLIAEKPSPPEGPIKFSDIEKTSITLSWQPPKSDGGSPLTAYYIEMRDSRIFSWSPVTKLAPGVTTFCVQNLKEKREFVFRVIAENAVGKSEPLTSEAVMPRSPFSKYLLINLTFQELYLQFLLSFLTFSELYIKLSNFLQH